MKNQVFVVTAGSYSDYSIRGIFSMREKAEKYIANCKAADGVCWYSDWNDIEVWDLDCALQERIYTRWSVGIWLKDGGVAEKVSSSEYWGVPEASSYVAESVPCYDGRGVVRAESHKSAEHCLKVAAEARQAWLRERKRKGG